MFLELRKRAWVVSFKTVAQQLKDSTLSLSQLSLTFRNDLFYERTECLLFSTSVSLSRGERQ